jgi:hypothetical protein
MNHGAFPYVVVPYTEAEDKVTRTLQFVRLVNTPTGYMPAMGLDMSHPALGLQGHNARPFAGSGCSQIILYLEVSSFFAARCTVLTHLKYPGYTLGPYQCRYAMRKVVIRGGKMTMEDLSSVVHDFVKSELWRISVGDLLQQSSPGTHQLTAVTRD